MQLLRSAYRIPFPVTETLQRLGTFDTFFYDYLYFNTVLAICVVAFCVFLQKHSIPASSGGQNRFFHVQTAARQNRFFYIQTAARPDFKSDGSLLPHYAIQQVNPKHLQKSVKRSTLKKRFIRSVFTAARTRHHPDNPRSLPRRLRQSRSAPLPW